MFEWVLWGGVGELGGRGDPTNYFVVTNKCNFNGRRSDSFLNEILFHFNPVKRNLEDNIKYFVNGR